MGRYYDRIRYGVFNILTAKAIQGFSESVLAYRYDNPKPTPPHHIEMWEYCCSTAHQVAIAAPRGSAKSTAITFAYLLAVLFFREHKHVLILSANEEIASQFLNDVKVEIQENEVLQQAFGFKRFVKDRETEIIVELKDGYRFRVLVKGAEQRMRGLKWERMRPSLVIPDDLEDEELVASEPRREKFRRWFYGAVKPILRDGGQIRMVGTIMHMDSLLNRFMPPIKDNKTVNEPLRVYTTAKRAWKSILFRAHNEDFSILLWPEMFSEEKLRAIRQDFSEQGMLDVYSQEYLNNPIDETTAYFRKSDFREMKPEHHEVNKIFYAAGDLAITETKKSAYTCFMVGGLDSERRLFITDNRRDRIDSLKIADEMFSIQERWEIATFRLESENIAKSIGPFLKDRMGRVYNGKYCPFINLDAKPPTKDKLARAQTIRAMMRAGRVYFDKEAEWYPDLEEEMLHFPKWPYKDQVDTIAWLGLMIEEMAEGLTQEELDDEDYEEEWEDEQYGQSTITGY